MGDKPIFQACCERLRLHNSRIFGGRKCRWLGMISVQDNGKYLHLYSKMDKYKHDSFFSKWIAVISTKCLNWYTILPSHILDIIFHVHVWLHLYSVQNVHQLYLTTMRLLIWDRNNRSINSIIDHVGYLLFLFHALKQCCFLRTCT